MSKKSVSSAKILKPSEIYKEACEPRSLEERITGFLEIIKITEDRIQELYPDMDVNDVLFEQGRAFSETPSPLHKEEDGQEGCDIFKYYQLSLTDTFCQFSGQTYQAQNEGIVDPDKALLIFERIANIGNFQHFGPLDFFTDIIKYAEQNVQNVDPDKVAELSLLYFTKAMTDLHASISQRDDSSMSREETRKHFGELDDIMYNGMMTFINQMDGVLDGRISALICKSDNLSHKTQPVLALLNS